MTPPRESPNRGRALEQQAQALRDHLGRAEEVFELDELDRVARRYARAPASGGAEALEALAVVVRCVPALFTRTEVNLEPRRLEDLADRARALALLREVLGRFAALVSDSQMELGDEMVELLTVGWARASGVDELLESLPLDQAMRMLRGYAARVAREGAHRSVADGTRASAPGGPWTALNAEADAHG